MLMDDSILSETGNVLSLHFIRNSPRPTINVEPWESARTFNDLCRAASRRQLALLQTRCLVELGRHF